MALGNYSIAVCKWCNNPYCMECSTHSGWKRFCSDRCEQDFKEDEDGAAPIDLAADTGGNTKKDGV